MFYHRSQNESGKRHSQGTKKGEGAGRRQEALKVTK